MGKFSGILKDFLLSWHPSINGFCLEVKGIKPCCPAQRVPGHSSCSRLSCVLREPGPAPSLCISWDVPWTNGEGGWEGLRPCVWHRGGGCVLSPGAWHSSPAVHAPGAIPSPSTPCTHAQAVGHSPTSQTPRCPPVFPTAAPLLGCHSSQTPLVSICRGWNPGCWAVLELGSS